jgi:hypothetical protein
VSCNTLREIDNAFRLGYKNHYQAAIADSENKERDFSPIENIFVTKELLDDLGACPKIWGYIEPIVSDLESWHVLSEHGAKWGLVKIWFKNIEPRNRLEEYARMHQDEWNEWFENAVNKYRSCNMARKCCYRCCPCEEDIETNIDYKARYKEARSEVEDLRDKLDKIEAIMSQYL